MTAASLLLASLLAEAPAPPVPAGGDPLAVRAPVCPADVLAFPAFVDLLRVELAGTRFRCCDVVEPERWPPAPPVVSVDLSVSPCQPDLAVAWLEVRDPVRHSRAHRGLTISRLDPTARPRALALIAAELLRSTEDDPPPAVVASESEPGPVSSGAGPQAGAAGVDRAQPPPARRDPDAAASPVRAVAGPGAPRPPAPRRDPGAAAVTDHAVADEGGHGAPALLVEGELRGFPAHTQVLWGVRAGFSASVGRRLVLSADAGLMSREQTYEVGTIQLIAGTIGLALGPRWSPGGVVTITAGGRGELGWAKLRGEVDDPLLARVATATALIASAGACAAVEWPARTTLRARLAAQGGAVLRGLVGTASETSPSHPGGTSTAGIAGAFWSIAFSLAMAL